jgi:hypothetical protein
MGMIVRLYGRGFEEHMERDAGVFVQVFFFIICYRFRELNN